MTQSPFVSALPLSSWKQVQDVITSEENSQNFFTRQLLHLRYYHRTPSHSVSYWPHALGITGLIFQERTQIQGGKWLIQVYPTRKWQDLNSRLSGCRAVLSFTAACCLPHLLHLTTSCSGVNRCQGLGTSGLVRELAQGRCCGSKRAEGHCLARDLPASQG